MEVCANYECLGSNWYQPFCCFTVLIKVCYGSFLFARCQEKRALMKKTITIAAQRSYLKWLSPPHQIL